MDDIWTPCEEQQITVEVREIASQELITKFAEMNCCHTLDMDKPDKSKGKVFEWRDRLWICTGSCWQYHATFEVDLREVVEAHLYDGPTADINVRGPDYYVGGYFKCKKKEYRMLPFELILIREDRALWKQEAMFQNNEVEHGV